MFRSQIHAGPLRTVIRIRLVKNKLHAFLRDKEALAIVEYALAAGLIVAAIAAAMQALSFSINTIITSKNTILAP